MAGNIQLTVISTDTGPVWQATLTDSNGAINLTNATTVKIAGKGNTSGTPIGPAACTVVVAATGQISYAPTITDTGTPDIYPIEFAIHWSNGTVQRVPNSAAARPQIEIDAVLVAGE